MAELTTKTAGDVATEVKRLFGDEDAVQISDNDIIRWVNDAQRKIVSVNPILQDRAIRDVVAGQAEYPYPPERVQYIQAILYDGIPLEGISYAEAQEYILKAEEGAREAEVPKIWYQWAQTIVLWPKPSKSLTGGLTMDYLAIPEEVTGLLDTLSVPDRYFETVIDHVMVKAHLLDEDYSAADFARSRVSETLGQLSEQENKPRHATYPTMTVLAEDL